MTFDELIKECCQDRKKAERYEHNKKKVNGEYIYIDFCVWCNAHEIGSKKHDCKVFEQYIKENNIVANWWQKKRIYENHFGFQFEYKDNKWVKVKL